MSQLKFTSGPLHVDTKWKPYVVQKDGIVLAELWENSVISGAEAEANAHLYSAAPEMYAELARIEDILEDSEDCGEISIDRIKTILRKARGESETQK